MSNEGKCISELLKFVLIEHLLNKSPKTARITFLNLAVINQVPYEIAIKAIVLKSLF